MRGKLATPLRSPLILNIVHEQSSGSDRAGSPLRRGTRNEIMRLTWKLPNNTAARGQRHLRISHILARIIGAPWVSRRIDG